MDWFHNLRNLITFGTCIPTLRNIWVKECEGGAGSPDKTYWGRRTTIGPGRWKIWLVVSSVLKENVIWKISYEIKETKSSPYPYRRDLGKVIRRISVWTTKGYPKDKCFLCSDSFYVFLKWNFMLFWLKEEPSWQVLRLSNVLKEVMLIINQKEPVGMPNQPRYCSRE